MLCAIKFGIKLLKRVGGYRNAQLVRVRVRVRAATGARSWLDTEGVGTMLCTIYGWVNGWLAGCAIGRWAYGNIGT